MPVAVRSHERRSPHGLNVVVALADSAFMDRAPKLRRILPVGCAALLLMLGMGCAAVSIPGFSTTDRDYFRPPSADDVWSAKIKGWQRRERFDARLLQPLATAPAVESAGFSAANAALPADQSDPDGLRRKYFEFRAERKRSLARDVAAWIQAEAKRHYREDGAIDHWATLEETLARGGDDCDGLELLAFHALRDLGFDAKEVYRAIVVRPSDGQHHMVTLWFENPDDPWVIDPTGAMTLGMPRMSEMKAWTPIKLFTETVEYTVQERRESLAQNP